MKGRFVRRFLLIGLMSAAALGLIAPAASASSIHFIGSRSCTFSSSTGNITCSFKVAGLGNVSTATIQLVFGFQCTNQGGNNPPGQASTQPTTVPVSNGQITVTNQTFTTNASCPDHMTPSVTGPATLFVNGQAVGTIPVTNTA